MSTSTKIVSWVLLISMAVALPLSAAAPTKKKKIKAKDTTEKVDDDAVVGHPDDPTAPRYGAAAKDPLSRGC